MADISEQQQSEVTRITDGTETHTLGINSDGSAKVNEGAFVTASSIEKTITGETLAAVGVANLSGRKTLIIQALNKPIKIGFTSGQLPFLIEAGNFFEAKISDAVNMYVDLVSGSSADIAFAEMK